MSERQESTEGDAAFVEAAGVAELTAAALQRLCQYITERHQLRLSGPEMLAIVDAIVIVLSGNHCDDTTRLLLTNVGLKITAPLAGSVPAGLWRTWREVFKLLPPGGAGLN